MQEGKDPETGRFLPGNRFWEARSSHGRKPTFESPEQLEAACLEYFKWNEDNPLWEVKAFHAAGEITYANVPKMRAMTIWGLCGFLDISKLTWDNYRANPDFIAVITRVEEGIRQQKFEGASAEFLNANIIARDLGLRDKQEHTGPGGGPVEHKVITHDMSSEQAAEIYRNLLSGD